MKSLILILAILTLAACSAVDPAPTGPRVELLTPIPGVSTIERVTAAKLCFDGLTAAGMTSLPIIREAQDETKGGPDALAKVDAANKALLEARQKGVGNDVLKSCKDSIGYAEQARAIRQGRAPAPATK